MCIRAAPAAVAPALHKRTCSPCADSSVSLGLRSSQVVLQADAWSFDIFHLFLSFSLSLFLYFRLFARPAILEFHLLITNRITTRGRNTNFSSRFLNGHEEHQVQVIMSRIVILMAVILHVLCAKGKRHLLNYKQIWGWWQKDLARVTSLPFFTGKQDHGKLLLSYTLHKSAQPV